MCLKSEVFAREKVKAFIFFFLLQKQEELLEDLFYLL